MDGVEMCNSPFKLPGQYHYDVFAVNEDDSEYMFMCSTTKEVVAAEIAKALCDTDPIKGVYDYRVRTRPTRSHTIFTFKGDSK